MTHKARIHCLQTIVTYSGLNIFSVQECHSNKILQSEARQLSAQFARHILFKLFLAAHEQFIQNWWHLTMHYYYVLFPTSKACLPDNKIFFSTYLRAPCHTCTPIGFHLLQFLPIHRNPFHMQHVEPHKGFSVNNTPFSKLLPELKK